MGSILNNVTSKMTKYEPNCRQITDVDSLSAITEDTDNLLSKMPTNCRNISDQVYPGVYIGDKSAATNKVYLKKIGITHILNVAEGNSNGSVNTNEKYYNPVGIEYKGINLVDTKYENISKHFEETSDFIEETLVKSGVVLVNCQKGVSRSSTVVLAYLMLKKNMTAVEALLKVRESRDVKPNHGFLLQLADLDNNLRRQRGLLFDM